MVLSCQKTNSVAVLFGVFDHGKNSMRFGRDGLIPFPGPHWFVQASENDIVFRTETMAGTICCVTWHLANHWGQGSPARSCGSASRNPSSAPSKEGGREGPTCPPGVSNPKYIFSQTSQISRIWSRDGHFISQPQQQQHLDTLTTCTHSLGDNNSINTIL